MDVLQLAQILFMSQLDPADVQAADIPAVRNHVLGVYGLDYDCVLAAVGRQFHLSPKRSAARMATCLVVAFGYLDSDDLADALLSAVFGGDPGRGVV